MPARDEGWSQGEVEPDNSGSQGPSQRQGLWDCHTFTAEMGKRLVSDSSVLVPILINFEGLGASLNARERSRADVYFLLFPFKDNFIKSLCFHSGLNIGHLNGKVIISPCLLVEKESRKRGREVSERKRLTAHTITFVLIPASMSKMPPHTGTRRIPTERHTLSTSF